jgi:hypothetical protein
MPHQASTQVTRTQGSLRGGVPPPQRGVWGSAPPDPGSALTRNICNPQILIVEQLACTDLFNTVSCSMRPRIVITATTRHHLRCKLGNLTYRCRVG